MTYQPQSEHHRQYERTYRLGMQGGWTQGAIWTKRILITLVVCLLIALIGPRVDRSGTLAGIIVNLYLTPSAVVSGYVWQIFTAPWFGCLCIWQFAFHLLYLLVFGPKVEREWGGSRFLRYYLIIAFLSGLVSVFLRLPSPQLSVIPASTASAAIFAVMVAYASMWPRDPFWVFGMFPAPVVYIIIFLCAMEILLFILAGAGQMGVDFAASAVGVGLGVAAMKVPWVRAILVGEKKERVVTAAKRAGKQEYSGATRTTSRSSQSQHSPTQQSTEKPKKKGKRSGFLEL